MERDLDSDDRQERITKALEDQSPKLSGMYRSALSLLRSKPESGCEVARVSMICHCFREIMNNLPAVMANSYIRKRPDPSSDTLISQLKNRVEEHPELNLDLDQDLILVPQEVAKHLSEVFKAMAQEEGRNKHNAAALINEGSDPEHPSIKQWNNTYRFFVKWAHLDRHGERNDQLPSDQELLASMRVVEDVIEVRTAAFFDNVRAVSDLLAAANATSEEDV